MKAIIYLLISIFLLSLFFLSSKIYQHFPINYILEIIPEADKYVHAFIFFIFVLIIDFFLGIFAPFWLTLLILILLGFSIELIQFFIGRTFDWYDVLADVAGIVLGLLYIYFKRVYIIM